MKVLLYEQPFGQSLSAIHAYELWAEMRLLGVEATFLTEEPKLPETVARVIPRLAGQSPRLRWTRPRTVYPHLKFRMQKLQPLRSLLTLYNVWQQDQNLLRLAQLQPPADIVYRRHSYLDTNTTFAHRQDLPSVVEVNGIVQDEAPLNWWSTAISNKIVSHWENSHFGQADHYIVVSEHLKDVLVDRFGVPADKVTIVLNGVNVRRFYPMDPVSAKKQLRLNPANQYVLFSGSLAPWQGVEYLIKAMPTIREKFPSVVLLIAGSGAEHDRLKALAALLCPTTQFLGQVPHAKVPLYISASTVCCLPRVKSYNDDIGISPLKLCEYLACGRPVVASDIRGLECLHYEECGTLVPPENPKALAAAVCDHLGNRQRSYWMGQNGRHYVVEQRSWRLAARKTLNILEDTMKEYKNG